MKQQKQSFAGIALLLASFAPVHAWGDVERADSMSTLFTMSADQKKQAQQYVMSHSFEFSSIFKSHHPDSDLILEHVKQLQLSSEQIKQQEELKFGMARSTTSGNIVLQNADKKHASDASATEPLLTIIKQLSARRKPILRWG